MLASIVLPRAGLSAVTLWPALLERSQFAPPCVLQELVPFRHGRSTHMPFRFVPGQRLFALVTHGDDAKAGWAIAAGSLKLSVDPLSCANAGDVGFSIFHTVAGLLMTAEMAGCEFIEEIDFMASAVLYGDPAPMRHGLTILYEDFRCRAVPRHFQRHGWPNMGYPHDRREGVTLDVVPFQALVVDYSAPEIPADDPAVPEEA